MIVIFSGSSGVGKNTVINELIKDGVGRLMPTYTTRRPREGEKEGFPYYYVTKEEFEAMLAKDEFYEHELVHGQNYYGAHKSVVGDIINDGGVFMKDIDVLGAMNLKETLSDKVKILTIYLHIDKDVLIQRLQGRGETDIDARLKRFDFEHSFIDKYDVAIENVSLEETVKLCKKLIEQHKGL